MRSGPLKNRHLKARLVPLLGTSRENPKRVLPGISGPVIEGTTLPFRPTPDEPRKPRKAWTPAAPPRKLCCPPSPRKGVGVKGKKVLGVGLGSVVSVVSVAHPGWGGRIENRPFNHLPHKSRMNLFFVAVKMSLLLRRPTRNRILCVPISHLVTPDTFEEVGQWISWFPTGSAPRFT